MWWYVIMKALLLGKCPYSQKIHTEVFRGEALWFLQLNVIARKRVCVCVCVSIYFHNIIVYVSIYIIYFFIYIYYIHLCMHRDKENWQRLTVSRWIWWQLCSLLSFYASGDSHFQNKKLGEINSKTMKYLKCTYLANTFKTKIQYNHAKIGFQNQTVIIESLKTIGAPQAVWSDNKHRFEADWGTSFCYHEMILELVLCREHRGSKSEAWSLSHIPCSLRCRPRLCGSIYTQWSHAPRPWSYSLPGKFLQLKHPCKAKKAKAVNYLSHAQTSLLWSLLILSLHHGLVYKIISLKDAARSLGWWRQENESWSLAASWGGILLWVGRGGGVGSWGTLVVPFGASWDPTWGVTWRRREPQGKGPRRGKVGRGSLTSPTLGRNETVCGAGWSGETPV